LSLELNSQIAQNIVTTIVTTKVGKLINPALVDSNRATIEVTTPAIAAHCGASPTPELILCFLYPVKNMTPNTNIKSIGVKLGTPPTISDRTSSIPLPFIAGTS